MTNNSDRTKESYVVTIERILPGGVGLAHTKGKTIFVSLAAKGDVVRISIDREQGNLLFASIDEVLEPSADRVEPPCPYFGRCGGCDFQQLNYEAQLNAKAEIIRDCLHRIAHLDIPKIVVVPAPVPWHYRARATWQIDPEQKTIGYYERGSRRVCDVAECAVLVPALQNTLEEVRKTPTDLVPDDLKHLDAVVGDNGVSLAPAFADFQTRELSLTVGEETYNYSAAGFFQVNQEVLRDVIEFALNNLVGETALDLYCGVGLFTLPLARHFRTVIGVESNSVATRFARRNLQQAELLNANIVTASVTDWFRSTLSTRDTVDFVLLDPPRAGAESVVIKGILDLKPSKICYVSCDPATLARDLKKLIAGGFGVEAISGFDMFPQTHHVETVVHLVS
ncbi:MAG TPA: class I SAM-dependent RNA methyltransferase [Pyrinomonadaceae bacterium]|jgi:23S rRNA (uracil1939-C5)-methyltransferase|nr:class I SAM-dependent RNA methyltransferase [Pyrinomonadaceae bacterium]